MLRQFILILHVLGFCFSLYGQDLFPILGGQRAGTSVFTFLNIGVSAKAVGMGESVVALNQDAASIYYNPASIAQLKDTEISMTQIKWPADINYDFFSLTHRFFKEHYLGLNAGILHMEPMAETTEYHPDGTGNYFLFQDRFIGITYGSKMTDRFSFGLTFKYVTEDMAGYDMSAILMDMGTFYWTGYGSLRFCASLSNFGKTVAPKGSYEKRLLDSSSGSEIQETTLFQKFSPPTQFRVGAALDPLKSNKQRFTISVQLNHPVDNAEYVVTGLEYVFSNVLFLRAGHKFNKYEEDFTFGLGVVVPAGLVKISVDYGYANFDHLSDPQRFSIGLTF
ncbi:MAG: PorV/PorQ family protein [Candidatus Neomarinimicrobiota bacterium]